MTNWKKWINEKNLILFRLEDLILIWLCEYLYGITDIDTDFLLRVFVKDHDDDQFRPVVNI